MEVIKRTVLFLMCFFASAVLLLLSGYGNFMNNISESLAVSTFFGGAVVIAIVFFLMLQMYLNVKKQLTDIYQRIEELEGKKKNG